MDTTIQFDDVAGGRYELKLVLNSDGSPVEVEGPRQLALFIANSITECILVTVDGVHVMSSKVISLWDPEAEPEEELEAF